MAFCSYCGTKLNANAMFCHNCGKESQPSANRQAAPVSKATDISLVEEHQIDKNGSVTNMYVRYLSAVLSAEERCMFYEKMIDRLQQLKRDYQNKRELTWKTVYSEKAPEKPKAPEEVGLNGHIWGFIFFLFFGGIIGVFLGWIPWLIFQKIVPYRIIILANAIILGVLCFIGSKKGEEAEWSAYNTAYDQYEKDVETQKKAKADFEKKRALALRIINDRLAACEANIQTFNAKLNEAYNDRNNLYSMNILYPDYQNVTACSYIIQYFLSKRCFSLGGANGAYNLYELEKRLDHIINSLDTMIECLREIDNSINRLSRTVGSGFRSVFSSMQEQNELIMKLADGINRNTDALESKMDANNAILKDINKIETIRLQETKNYQNYVQFAIKQKRYEEGHYY